MDRFTARRKLLRGSLAAPLVLTVASPSVLAQTTFTSCLANGGDPLTPADRIVLSDADDFYRVQKDVFPIVGGTSNGRHVYQWDGAYYFADNGNAVGTLPEGVTIGEAGTSRWFVAYVDQTGTVKGWGWDNTAGGGTVAMKSCYHSLLIQPDA